MPVAQVMVNFRIDEDVKKSMEQACREMGLSMTAAFTIFATKVGKEKRIPFEITAEPGQRRRCPAGIPRGAGAEEAALSRELERLEPLFTDIRQSLTRIHTAIPSAITGLPMERIRLLCGGELKEKAAEAAKTARALLAGPGAQPLGGKDPGVLKEYMDGLSSIAEELRDVERALIPAMKAWPGGDAGGFEPYGQRLAALSRKFDGLPSVMQRFLRSAARGAGAVQTRIRTAAASVETAYVLTALENLDGLILQYYDTLAEQTRIRVEADYLPTLELTLRELGQAERDGGDAGAKAALCLRAVNVLVQVVSDGRRARREWGERSLEAEVAALERLAAMRGDVGDAIGP